MIDIGTYDFISRLRAARAFAPSSRDDKDNALVRIEWDGTQLRFSAYGVNYGAIATWKPDDKNVDYGNPWSILLPNGRVNEVIKDFELKSERTQHAPLMVQVDFDRLTIRRAGSAEDGVPAKTFDYRTEVEHDPPKVMDVFSDLGEPETAPQTGITSQVLVALGLVAKATHMDAWVDRYKRGVRITSGWLTAFCRHPIDQEQAQAAADEDAIVGESMAHLSVAA